MAENRASVLSYFDAIFPRGPAHAGSRGALLELREFAHFDVFECDEVAVVLQAEVAFGGFAKAGHGGEFGLGDFVVPFGGAHLVFDIFCAVHEVGAGVGAGGGLLAFDDHVVPFADGFCGVHGGGVELVHPAGLLWIVSSDVVLDLALGAGGVAGAFGFEHFEHEAAVAAGADFPINLKFEALVLFFGDDVAAACLADECAVFGDPAVGHFVFVVAAEICAGIGAVEEVFPAAGFFFGGEFVIRAKAGECGEGECEECE